MSRTKKAQKQDDKLSNFNKRMQNDGVNLTTTTVTTKPCKLNCFLCGKRIDGDYFLYNYIVENGSPPKNQYIAKQCKSYLDKIISGEMGCDYVSQIKD